MDVVQRFSERVLMDWLPTYCQDRKRNYDPSGFRAKSIKVAEVDACDCMVAIDQGIVVDTGGGRFSACRSSAQEVLFWEGRKSEVPRPITLWLEPVITFAALARLHNEYAWPKENLGMQSEGWAFDLATYESSQGHQPRILGEIKKTKSELIRLQVDLLRLSSGAAPDTVSANSRKKWDALLTARPSLLWLVGPNNESYVYAPAFSGRECTLHEVSLSALTHSAA